MRTIPSPISIFSNACIVVTALAVACGGKEAQSAEDAPMCCVVDPYQGTHECTWGACQYPNAQVNPPVQPVLIQLYATQQKGRVIAGVADPNMPGGQAVYGPACFVHEHGPGVCYQLNMTGDFHLDPLAPNRVLLPVKTPAFMDTYAQTQIASCYPSADPQCAGNAYGVTTWSVNGESGCCTIPQPFPPACQSINPGCPGGGGDFYGYGQVAVPTAMPAVTRAASFFPPPPPPSTPAMGLLGVVGLGAALAGVGALMARPRG